MKIQNLKAVNHNGRRRVSANIIWENCRRPAQELYFATDQEFADDLTPDPHAFLVAAALPALYYGERRVRIDGAVCPRLLENIEVAMAWIVHWFHTKKHKPPVIEADQQNDSITVNKPERTGFLFSGGIDSLATLRYNHQNYPDPHPGRIRDGLIIYGLEVRDPASFRNVLSNLEPIAMDAGIHLIPLYTNIRELGPARDRDFWAGFWTTHYMGAALAATIHILSKRFSGFSINACDDIPNLEPYSTNPLIDPYYSSNNLRIMYTGLQFSRFEKTRIVAGWDVALRYLRVCNNFNAYRQGALNCGVCEKCVRTMLALVACGALDRATAFPERNISAENVMTSVTLKSNIRMYYRELVEPLDRMGRSDLAQAVKQKLESFENGDAIDNWRTRAIDALAAIDDKRFNGLFRKIHSRIASILS